MLRRATISTPISSPGPCAFLPGGGTKCATWAGTREKRRGRRTTSGHPNGGIGPHPCQCFGTPLCRRKITMRASARLLFAIAFIGGMDNAALAGSRASLADLLGQGYEVKATSTLSLTDSKALNEANITPTVLVTLQKGPSIAVCTFGAPFWELIGTAKNDPLQTSERCDVTQRLIQDDKRVLAFGAWV